MIWRHFLLIYFFKNVPIHFLAKSLLERLFTFCRQHVKYWASQRLVDGFCHFDQRTSCLPSSFSSLCATVCTDNRDLYATKWIIFTSVVLLILFFNEFLFMINTEGVEPGQCNTALSPERLLHCDIAWWRLLLLLLPLVWKWNGKLPATRNSCSTLESL